MRIVLARNPDYWDKGRPYIDEYTILSTPDAATRARRVPHGPERHSSGWPSPSEVETVRKTQSRRGRAGAHANTLAPFGLALAQDKPPFNDLRVRRAHLDGHRPAEAGGHGVRGPRHSRLGRAVHLLPGQDADARSSSGPGVQYRPAEAKKLLAEAGHPNGFETTLFYYEYFPQMTSQVQLVQQDLKKNLNINMKITKLDYTSYYGRYVESKWDGMAWGFQSGHAVGLDERTYHYLHSKSTKNFFRVNDPVHRRADHQAAADARIAPSSA